jgi:hypothetical protein
MRLTFYMHFSNLHEECRLKTNKTYSFNLIRIMQCIKHTLKLIIISNFKQDRKYVYQ